MICAELL